MSARVNDGAAEKGLRALGEEIARVRQHGFGEAELDRAKRSALASYERAYNERGTTESGGYASELLRNYLSDEAAPGIEIELDLVRQFLPTITAAGNRRSSRATSSPTGVASSSRRRRRRRVSSP